MKREGKKSEGMTAVVSTILWSDSLEGKEQEQHKSRSGTEGYGKLRVFERGISEDHDLTVVGWDGGRRGNRKSNERSRKAGTQAPERSFSPEKC